VQKLEAAQFSLKALQQRPDSLAQHSAQDAAREKAVEAKVNDLIQLLHDREVALDQKDELLAHDRDIRDTRWDLSRGLHSTLTVQALCRMTSKSSEATES
jgi:hypothetical protein